MLATQSSTNMDWRLIAEDLPCLENLDISSTHIHDISPLRKCKNRLKSLSMYNLLASNQDEVVPVLCDLTKTRAPRRVRRFLNAAICEHEQWEVCHSAVAGADKDFTMSDVTGYIWQGGSQGRNAQVSVVHVCTCYCNYVPKSNSRQIVFSVSDCNPFV